MRGRRFRTWAKWWCTLAAALAVGVAVFSKFYWVDRVSISSDGATIRSVRIREGLLSWYRFKPGLPDPDARRYAEKYGGAPQWTASRTNGWFWGLPGEAGINFPGVQWHAGLLYARDPSACTIGVSAVYPVLLTTIPAAFLWYKDRRRLGPHQCKKCGYDRQGLAADTKCPECGSPPAIA
jgi:hypothetical protein